MNWHCKHGSVGHMKDNLVIVVCCLLMSSVIVVCCRCLCANVWLGLIDTNMYSTQQVGRCLFRVWKFKSFPDRIPALM